MIGAKKRHIEDVEADIAKLNTNLAECISTREVLLGSSSHDYDDLTAILESLDVKIRELEKQIDDLEGDRTLLIFSSDEDYMNDRWADELWQDRII